MIRYPKLVPDTCDTAVTREHHADRIPAEGLRHIAENPIWTSTYPGDQIADMDWYLLIKTAHILSATILFGTDMGIAFFMFRSHFTDDLTEKYFAARTTVLAAWCFTLPAVIIQPVTGAWLVWHLGFGWMETWLAVTYALYALAGLCWLPVVGIQLRLKQMIMQARTTDTPLPDRYYRLFRWWFWLGWPAFGGLIVIFLMMVIKPA